MAVRRSSSILCASALALAAFKVADVSFIGSKAATRTPGVARFYESGKLDDVQLPAIESDRKTLNTAIMGCMEEECTVEEVEELEMQLARHEQRISAAMAEVKRAHETDVALLSKEDYGFALDWYDNFLGGMKEAKAELRTSAPRTWSADDPKQAAYDDLFSHIRSHAEEKAKSKYSELRTDGTALDWYDNFLRGMRAVHAELRADDPKQAEYDDLFSHIRSHAELSAKSKYSELRTDGTALDWYDNFLRGMRAVHAELRAGDNKQAKYNDLFSHMRSHAELSAKSKYGELRTDGTALDWYDNYLRGMRAVHAELNAKSK